MANISWIPASALAIVLGGLCGGAYAADDDASKFDVAFGAAITSDYISRGITQTDHNPAIQAYIEPSFGILYAGIWASTVQFGGDKDAEVDLYFGVRPEFDKWAFDFGYNRATYAADPASNSGEVFAKATFSPSDNVSIGGEFYVNPDDTSATYTEANADLTLPHNFGISGAVGMVNGDTSYTTWNAGLYYSIGEWGKLDLRYSDTNLSETGCQGVAGLSGNECDARVMLTFSVDSAVSSLPGGTE